MPVDNSIYEAPGDIWWDETRPLSSLRTAINPGRLAYLAEVVGAAGLTAPGARALDIGCGGGLMAEEVARMGFAVTGVDPAVAAIEVARSHAFKSGLRIEYTTAGGESLPFPEDSFDLVYCCDVLEHVTDPGVVIGEAARVLRAGGIFFYDTINRTPASKLLMIRLFQEWALTAWMPRDLHSWEAFITPDEIEKLLLANHLDPRGMTGLQPSVSPPRMLMNLILLRRGRLTYGEFGRRGAFKRSRDTGVIYAGYAVKPAARANGSAPIGQA